jgi:hypothetical protein
MQIRMAADGSFSSYDDNFPLATLTGGAVCPGFNHAYDWNTRRLGDLVQS